MSATDRQNRLLVAEDWKRIYQTFRSADFQSYDFENLRRTMIEYIRQNYPEDFNDYIESSEYLALIDLIAFLGQSIAFRADLNARENFLELAERRDSILRLARTISYNAKRNIPAHGLLKFTSVQTTQTILDSNGRNLAGQVVVWNDASNNNWYDQFIKVLNAAFSTTQQFGNPIDSASIYGVPSEQYRFQAANSTIPVYSFTKTVDGRSTNFEITSTTFAGQSFIYEEPPRVANKPACVYRNDGQGAGSANTGFFMNFTQGTLNQGTFEITQPTANESIDIDANNINDSDVWLYKLNSSGAEVDLWTKTPSLRGNNVIYNSINKNVRDIYGVVTRASDSISLAFSDGTFGNLPSGTFRTYYRISNGISYSINPQDIKNVIISIPYYSNVGAVETLTIALSLQTTVSNASSTESNASVKANAPASYYTQNRMITGEDYNISPLTVNQQVAKVKAVNRTSSGISRYFDLTDPSGKYSSTNLFATDGVVYKELYSATYRFNYSSKTDIEGVIYNQIYNIFDNADLQNYYYEKYLDIFALSYTAKWKSVTSDSTSSTGYVANDNNIPQRLGAFTDNDLSYFIMGALVKFVAPSGTYFNKNKANKLVNGTVGSDNSSEYIWAKVVSVTDNGTGLNSTGVLASGFGAVTLSVPVPEGAVIEKVIPRWQTDIDTTVISLMVDLIFNNKPFGLRYDAVTQSWQVVTETTLDTVSDFNLASAGTLTDSSWLLLFTTDNEYYTVTTRNQRFVFESDSQVRFYFDKSLKIFDKVTDKIINDKINVLSINKQPDSTQPFTFDQSWDIVSEFIGTDGYVNSKKVIVSFANADGAGTVDLLTFDNLVSPSTGTITDKYIVQQRYIVSQGFDEYQYVDNSDNTVAILESEDNLNLVNYSAGQYFYFINTDTVKLFDGQVLDVSLDYKVFLGTKGLKFQYTHNADYGSRIDPGASNIIDIYVLTSGYDKMYRQWLSGALADKPLPPSSSELNNSIAPTLNLIKSISDEIVYHPVEYKVLFGSKATTDVQAAFKVIKNASVVASDNDIKSQVITAVNQFFALENWDFGDTFYFSELAAYVMNQLAPKISNFVIVPRSSGLYFGSLFQITANSNEIFINGATVDDIEIISTITPSTIKSITGSVVTNVVTQQTVTSSTYGSTNV